MMALLSTEQLRCAVSELLSREISPHKFGYMIKKRRNDLQPARIVGGVKLWPEWMIDAFSQEALRIERYHQKHGRVAVA